MDCSATENGWFEFKGFFQNTHASTPTFVDGYWESDIVQGLCTGTASVGQPSYSSNSHLAKCGYMNTYVWGSNICEINEI